MTTKEQIIQKLEQVSETTLEQVLEFLLTVKPEPPVNEVRSEVWNAYLASKQEREEVYRRLAE
jgi:hypothetical protein